MAGNQPRIVEDIGILASSDAVAVDQASADLVVERAGKDVFRLGYDVDWAVQLHHGEAVGLGRRNYELIRLS